MKRFAGVAFALSLAALLAGHIGSPNVLFEGAAGPYPVRVIVRPPEVVPGLADVVVRADANDVDRVSIRPVFWTVGAKGAPAGDSMKRVPGDAHSYAGQLWLMAYGSYSVYVTVSGARGSGTVIVPVASFATGRLPLSRGLTVILALLGIALVAGFLTIIRAASGEALVSPDEAIDAPRRRRANATMAVATPVLVLLLFGGAKWWASEDGAYQRKMFGSPEVDPTVVASGSGRLLRLYVHDTAAFRTIFVPLMPDHGKLMHLFLIGAPGTNAFAHLHPVRYDSNFALKFQTEVPALPEGRYRLFGDITLENGLSLTVTNTVDLPGSLSGLPVVTSGPVVPTDVDDAWSLAPAVTAAPSATVALGDGYTLVWAGSDASVAANHPIDLAFTVLDDKGRIASLQPYMGMAAHAAVVRDDGSVFIHLHPMGTVSAGAQQAFSARDRGDTTARGRLSPQVLETPPMSGMSMSEMSMSGTIAFPYEFPKSGHYRIWVEVKPRDKVLTGAFDVDVH